MKHYIKYPLLSFVLFLCSSSDASGQAYPYKNAFLPVGERVEDLLRRMTLEENFLIKWKQAFKVAVWEQTIYL